MDSDVAGLVERLFWSHERPLTVEQAHAAADAMQALVADNERLTAELASCRRLYNDLYSGEFAEIATKLRALIEENERLTEERDEEAVQAHGQYQLVVQAEAKVREAAETIARLSLTIAQGEAKLREAVKVMRDLLDWADDYQRWGMSPTHDALSPARAFLATVENTDEAVRHKEPIR